MASEGVADGAVRQVLAEHVLEELHHLAFLPSGVVDVRGAVLGDLLLLEVGGPQEILGLRMPAEVGFVEGSWKILPTSRSARASGFSVVNRQARAVVLLGPDIEVLGRVREVLDAEEEGGRMWPPSLLPLCVGLILDVPVR